MITAETIEGAEASPATARAELRAMFRLALPVVLVQVGFTAMGVADTVMVGHVSPTTLAAVALGNLYVFNATVFGMGTLMALDPLVAQAVGARDEPSVARAVQRGMLLAVLLAAITSILLVPVGWVLRAARQPAAIIPEAVSYVHVSIVGVFPFLAFVVMRQSLQAIGRMRPIVLAVLIANLVNIALNWVLIYGHLGSPALGAVGSAWSTVIGRWLMGAVLLALAWSELHPVLTSRHPEIFAPTPLLRMLHLGIPIGIQQGLESCAFGAIGLLMGMLGTIEVAAHQIAITLASLTFMVPLGVGAAAAVRVGHAVGAGDEPGARRAARAALVCGVGFMMLTALLFLTLPGPLARAYTADTGVLAVAITLIPIAGVFQVFDGVQAVAAGVLRGVGDTRVPLVIYLIGFWLVGLPVSAALGLRTSARAAGLWWGLVVALAAVAAVLLVRVRVRMRRETKRLSV